MQLNHVAIILDGNRRWAKERNLIPQIGHKYGAQNLQDFVIEANKRGLKYLTVYCFSTENWKRSIQEVNYLMKLFRVYFRKVINKIAKENIKIKFWGSDDNLDKKIIELKRKSEEASKNCTGLQLNICLNYGGRLEIKEMMQRVFKYLHENGLGILNISEDLIQKNLYSEGIADPEVVIRTSGEKRLSNFLLYQSSYSELFFVDKYWPDFKIEDLEKIEEEFLKRNRRFGGK